jgi:hypothetical protein
MLFNINRFTLTFFKPLTVWIFFIFIAVSNIVHVPALWHPQLIVYITYLLSIVYHMCMCIVSKNNLTNAVQLLKNLKL